MVVFDFLDKIILIYSIRLSCEINYLNHRELAMTKFLMIIHLGLSFIMNQTHYLIPGYNLANRIPLR